MSSARGTKVQFLFDSGTEVTQIPVAYRDLLDDIQELPQPLQLIIAGLAERPLTLQRDWRSTVQGPGGGRDLRDRLSAQPYVRHIYGQRG